MRGRANVHFAAQQVASYYEWSKQKIRQGDSPMLSLDYDESFKATMLLSCPQSLFVSRV